LTVPEFTATVKMNVILLNEGDKAGLIMMGRDYAYLSVSKKASGFLLEQIECKDAEDKTSEKVVGEQILKNPNVKEMYFYQTRVEKLEIYLRMTVKEGGLCTFSYSSDNKKYNPIGNQFKARQGKWIGAKTGMFVMNKISGSERSWSDLDWFRIEAP
jgi:hypothetical protein